MAKINRPIDRYPETEGWRKLLPRTWQQWLLVGMATGIAFALIFLYTRELNACA